MWRHAAQANDRALHMVCSPVVWSRTIYARNLCAKLARSSPEGEFVLQQANLEALRPSDLPQCLLFGQGTMILRSSSYWLAK